MQMRKCARGISNCKAEGYVIAVAWRLTIMQQIEIQTSDFPGYFAGAVLVSYGKCRLA